MLATKWLQSNLQTNQALTNQASPHSSNSSMPGAFDQDKLADLETTVLFKSSINLISSRINELALDSTLDPAKHSAIKILNLPAIYLFASVNEFCRAVVINRARIFYSLARIIVYNVAINEKIAEQYVEWKKITQIENRKKLQLYKDLKDLQQELNNSQKEFSAMLEEWD